ncbi:MAG: hypothetical protein H6737_10115 [Alphaproteobacteria bacterium]|nr:hypothetical protein [Alphaproteobacteria bacterium]
MFPMNDTVRKNLKTNIELSQNVAGQMMDWQASMVLASQKQVNAMFDGYRNVIEANHKAARAMQQLVVDSFGADAAAAA